ncbi:MAG TPA: hypothetical protein VF092_11675 [Longimicrobium sp.]
MPPALQHEPDELLEAVQVLAEIPTPVGVILWQSVRDVTLWSEIPDENREELFTHDAAHRRLSDLLSAGAEPALEVSLTTLAALVGAPGAASPEIVSLVCIQISRWAEGRGLWGTAMAYAQAAALATPLDSNPALFAGSLALRWRRSARAETWLRRAIGLARRGREWGVYAAAYVEMGALYARRAQPAQAHRFYVQGLRAARRHGLVLTRGAALHGMLRLAMETGALEEGERYARAAIRAFGRGNPRLPELVHDVAYLWVRRENYVRAIPMLQRLLPARVEPVERALTLALLARAAAGDGNQRLYQEAWLDAWAIINRRFGEEEKHGRALLELARASALFRDWAHVEQAVRLATTLATPEPAVASQVAELATSLRRRRRRGGLAEARLEEPVRRGPAPRVRLDADDDDDVSAEIEQLLQAEGFVAPAATQTTEESAIRGDGGSPRPGAENEAGAAAGAEGDAVVEMRDSVLAADGEASHGEMPGGETGAEADGDPSAGSDGDGGDDEGGRPPEPPATPG